MAQKIAYWITTALVALAYAAGGYFDIAPLESMREDMAKLGYPPHFFTILGVWKILAVVALLAPGLPRAKEWAYAGILINLTAASATHAIHGDPVGNIVTPIGILALAVASWALRPADRKLAGPWV